VISAESIDETVLRLFVEVSYYPKESATLETFLNDVLPDSMHLAHFIFVVEDHFAVDIEREDVEVLKTVGDLARRVRELLAKKGAAQ
jgi:acyl carrier protein